MVQTLTVDCWYLKETNNHGTRFFPSLFDAVQEVQFRHNIKKTKTFVKNISSHKIQRDKHSSNFNGWLSISQRIKRKSIAFFSFHFSMLYKRYSFVTIEKRTKLLWKHERNFLVTMVTVITVIRFDIGRCVLFI